MNPQSLFRPGAVDYGEITKGRYAAGRALGPRALEPWRRAVRTHLRHARRILDLGCGSGRFAPHLARWVSARVVGVDPSPAMLRDAPPAPGTAYILGRAEAIPLRAASADAAWLSQVMHHVADPERCAADLRRVLRPGAPVLVRGNHAGRLDGIVLFRYFPGAQRIAERFPTREQTLEPFLRQGFRLVTMERILQVTCEGLRELAARAGARADSTLALLADEEFEMGLAALERDAEAEAAPAPIEDPLDLLVLET